MTDPWAQFLVAIISGLVAFAAAALTLRANKPKIDAETEAEHDAIARALRNDVQTLDRETGRLRRLIERIWVRIWHHHETEHPDDPPPIRSDWIDDHEERT